MDLVLSRLPALQSSLSHRQVSRDISIGLEASRRACRRRAVSTYAVLADVD
jgi:hypothetical protein